MQEDFYKVSNNNQPTLSGGSSNGWIRWVILGSVLLVIVLAFFLLRRGGDVGMNVQECDGSSSCLQDSFEDLAGSGQRANVCRGLEGNALTECVAAFVLSTNSPDACRYLEEGDVQGCEDRWYLGAAVDNFDVKLCSRIENGTRREACGIRIAVLDAEDGSCDSSGDWSGKCEEEVSYKAIFAQVTDISECRERFDYDENTDGGLAARCESDFTSTDSDGDGLYLPREIELGTSDDSVDTDADGLTDADEVNVYGTSPVNPDTDGDGFADGLEVEGGFDPLSAPEVAE